MKTVLLLRKDIYKVTQPLIQKSSMDINEDILLSDNEGEASNQRKRVSSGDTTETKKPKIRKVKMVCLRVSKIYLILIIYCFNIVLVSPQRVFYSNHVMTLHSIKPVTHDDLTLKRLGGASDAPPSCLSYAISSSLKVPCSYLVTFHFNPFNMS